MKIIKQGFVNVRVLLLLPIAPVTRFLFESGSISLRVSHLLFIFIGIISSIIFRWDLFSAMYMDVSIIKSLVLTMAFLFLISIMISVFKRVFF
jgi:hypothetical protein